MAWPKWDGVEPYVDYLERNQNTAGSFQQGGTAAPGYDIYGMPLPDTAPAPAPATPAPAATPPTAAPATPAAVGQGTASQNSAIATINANLAALGLPASLAPWAWGEIQKGVDPAQVLIDLEGTPEFQKRFPAIQALRDRAANGEQVHVPSPGEYKSFEDTTAGLMRAAGIPAGFYDSPEDFTGFILKQTSPAEIADRIAGARTAAYQTAPEVRDFLASAYGMSTGDLTAFWLNPDKALPVIQNKFTAGEIGGAATKAGFTITGAQADTLQGEQVTGALAQQRFDQLGALKPLFTNTAGESSTGSGVGMADVLASVGGSAAANEKIRRAQQARLAIFQGGGGAASGGGRGDTGIGASGG